MKRGFIQRTNTGHWQAQWRDDSGNKITRIVGGPNDKAGAALAHLAKHFGLDQVGVKSSDIGPFTTLSAGPIVWMKLGWQA